jgi:hypothetical protein
MQAIARHLFRPKRANARRGYDGAFQFIENMEA